MPRIVECPKCGEDISESYRGYDPDVGIMSGGWFCDKCDVAVAEEDDSYDDFEDWRTDREGRDH